MTDREMAAPVSMFQDDKAHPSHSDADAPAHKHRAARRKVIFEKCLRFTRADELKDSGNYPYHRVIENGQDTEVLIDGKRMLMLGSNSYLELTTHPHVKARAIEAIHKYGTGCSGSRFLNGTLPIHLEVEARLAKLTGKEAALIFPTGFQTNTGVLSTLVHRGQYILSDKINHASIVDGCQISQGKMLRYNHNDMKDLERQLAKLPEGAGKLIVTDGIFSMEGDICNLPEIVRLSKVYNAQVMVDDAHATGVLGPGGAGTAAHFGLTDDVDLIMGTFSKSFAAIGGFVASSERVINYLKHCARPYMFSASAAPASVAAVLGALEVLEQEPERLQHLWDNAHYMKQGLEDLGFDTGQSESPIIPVFLGDLERCFQVWQFIQKAGIFVNPIVPPAVPPGRCMLRISVTAGHTHKQLKGALDKFAQAAKRFGYSK
jgi:8-amino-7-oxononanoate synthase